MNGFRPFKPYRLRPLCFFDAEGTGTKPGWHELTEVGLRHSEKGAKCIQIAPDHMDRAQPEALKVSRYNSSDWADARRFIDVVPEITEFVEDATIVGHNIFGYDAPMTKGVYEMHGLEHDHLFRDIIDTMSMARKFLVPLGLNRIGLGPCMKFIGREKEYEDAHNAYSDAVCCEILYNFIMGNLKWHGKREGKRIQEKLF